MKDWRIVVGCPIRDRAWIIGRWSRHVAEAVQVAEAALGVRIHCRLVFVGDPSTDPETFREVERIPQSVRVVEVEEDPGFPINHAWHSKRYDHMTNLRNTLLDEVRALRPDYFWSLDSDILAHPRSLELALTALRNDERAFAAMGQRCYMAAGEWCTSNAVLTMSGGMVRETVEGVIKVDVIMAAKLMKPLAYDVNYVSHRQGEDLGWCNQVRRRGLTLGWDGRVTSEHVMVRPPTVVDV